MNIITILRVGPELILSDPPRLAYIYKNVIKAFIFLPTYIYKNTIRVTHIYTSIFSTASSPFLFSQFCSSQTFNEKKTLSSPSAPHGHTPSPDPPMLSLSLSPSRCLHTAVSPSQPHTAASPANSLSHSPPHAAFTPPPAFHHRSNFDLLHACPATIPNEQKKISQNLFKAYSCV